jgi:hypothetical protein
MKANYARPCRVCSKPVTAGVDEYDPATKKSIHLACREQEAIPTAADFELAERLGYIPFDEAMAINWVLWNLYPRGGSSPAGRDCGPTQRGQNAFVFGER